MGCDWAEKWLICVDDDHSITMKERVRKMFQFALAGSVILHFTIVIVHVIPRTWKTDGINYWTDRYMYPVFQQSWNLFAPEPPTYSKLLEIRTHSEGEWSEWYDPGKRLLVEHQRYRLGYHGKLYNIHEAIHRNLHATYYRAVGEGMDEVAALRSVQGSPSGRVAVRYANSFTEEDRQLDSVQVRCSLLRVQREGGRTKDVLFTLQSEAATQ